MSAVENKNIENPENKPSLREILTNVFAMSEYEGDVLAANEKIEKVLKTVKTDPAEKFLTEFCNQGNLIHSFIGFPSISALSENKEYEAAFIKILNSAITFRSNPLNEQKNKTLFQDCFEIVATLLLYLPNYSIMKYVAGKQDKLLESLKVIRTRPSSCSTFISSILDLAFHNEKYKETSINAIVKFLTSEIQLVMQLCKQNPAFADAIKQSYKQIQDDTVEKLKNGELQDKDLVLLEKIITSKQILGEIFYFLAMQNPYATKMFIKAPEFNRKLFPILLRQLKTNEINHLGYLLKDLEDEEYTEMMYQYLGKKPEEFEVYNTFDDSKDQEKDLFNFAITENLFSNSDTSKSVQESIDIASDNLRNVIEKVHNICITKSISITICPYSIASLFRVINANISKAVGRKIDIEALKSFKEKQESALENNPAIQKIKNMNAAYSVMVCKKMYLDLGILSYLNKIMTKTSESSVKMSALEIMKSLNKTLIKANFFSPEKVFVENFKRKTKILKSIISK